MYAAQSDASRPDSTLTLAERVNGPKHELALQVFMVIVLAHWAEHLLQAIQIYVLGWPVPEARGVLGYFYPWLIKSEALHYGYAVVMLAGMAISASALRIASTASPSEAPGPRLKEIAVDGNWPR